MSRLPERLRDPLILCHLQGLTDELAARQLGCPVGTVRSRLARARALLQKRIVRRGFSLPAGAVATTLESNAKPAAVPPHFRSSLIKVATRCCSESASLAGGVGATASFVALWFMPGTVGRKSRDRRNESDLPTCQEVLQR